MNLPDFMSYSNKFTASDFVEKISRIAKRAGAKLVYAALILYYTLQSDKISVKDKAIIVGALGYLISPLDVIPDAIPIAGLGDDLAVLIYVLNKVWGNVSEEIKENAKVRLTKWFDEDEIAEWTRQVVSGKLHATGPGAGLRGFIGNFVDDALHGGYAGLAMIVGVICVFILIILAGTTHSIRRSSLFAYSKLY